eukprot:TRINITY_DN31326_c0_g1_i2.p1 TRINITY_DN31326_c0_g1~~TRINITY_DN31326_c0_g1_i2.p1  ORF type:complete len:152 (+),score=34.46 TRINITY_DN31326_c0_g1_i2:200-655(+)
MRLSSIVIFRIPIDCVCWDPFAWCAAGRVKTLSGAMMLSGAACGLCMVLPDGGLTTTAAMTGKFGITASFAIVFVYAAELFPTVVRSLAMGLSSTAARVGGVMAPGVVLLSATGKALPLLVLSLIHISEPTRLLSISYAVFCLKKKKIISF